MFVIIRDGALRYKMIIVEMETKSATMQHIYPFSTNMERVLFGVMQPYFELFGTFWPKLN